MDIATLTTRALTAITAFLKGAVGGSTKKANKTLQEQGKRLYETAQARLQREDDEQASQALSSLAQEPAVRAVVEEKLALLLLYDPQFALTMQDIIQADPLQPLSTEEEAAIGRIRQYLSENVGKERKTRKKGLTK